MLATITGTLSIELLSSYLAHPIQTWTFDESATRVAIGRCASNHVVIHSNVVSRYHLILEKANGAWYLRSLGKNGCYINDRLVNNIALPGTALVRLGQTGSYLRIEVGALERRSQELGPKPASKKRIFVGKAARDFIAQRQSQSMERTQTIEPQQMRQSTSVPAADRRKHFS